MKNVSRRGLVTRRSSTQVVTSRPQRLVLVALLAVGCVGEIGDGGSTDPTNPADPGPVPPVPALGCTDDEQALPFQDLRRLTKYEYTNALSALLHRLDFTSIESTLGLIPEDRVGSDFDTLSQGLSTSHVLGYAKVAEAVGSHLFRSEDARSRTIRCLDEATDNVCMHEFIRDFGARVYRRALFEEEEEEYRTLYGVGLTESKILGLRLVVTAMLQAPQFLFKMELDGADVPDQEDHVFLTDDELAQKLSFYVWGTPPDDLLREAAAAGTLTSEAGLLAHFDRMIEDEQAPPHLERFFSQWLDLDRLPDLENVARYRLNGLGTNHLNFDAREEIRLLTNYIVWELQGSFFDLMTTREGFPSGHMGGIYAPNDYTCCGAKQVTLVEDRAGILSRIAILGNVDGIQHPIIRGHRIREKFLCDDLVLPTPEELGEGEIVDPEFDAAATTRTRFERLTAPRECAGCHARLNPLGFALSGFDGLGRAQTVESIYDESGELVGEVPIDSTVDPGLGDEPTTVRGPADLGALLATHPEAIDCMAEQWLEYNAAREREYTDECAIADIADAVASEDAGYLEMMRRWVMRPEFRVRRIRRELP